MTFFKGEYINRDTKKKKKTLNGYRFGGNLTGKTCPSLNNDEWFIIKFHLKLLLTRTNTLEQSNSTAEAKNSIKLHHIIRLKLDQTSSFGPHAVNTMCWPSNPNLNLIELRLKRVMTAITIDLRTFNDCTQTTHTFGLDDCIVLFFIHTYTMHMEHW